MHKQGNHRYQTSPAVCNRNNVGPNPVNDKLTSLSYVHESNHSHWCICFSASVHRYHSNKSYGDARFGNSSR